MKRFNNLLGILCLGIALIATKHSSAQLYDFDTHTFTNAGALGKDGPTLAACQTVYAAAVWELDPSLFNMTTQGIQEWTVPATGNYQIEVAGGKGGDDTFTGHPEVGGFGARMTGTFFLTEGQILHILVGQTGESTRASVDNAAAGGGGGTFVWDPADDALPLIVAGGGGGAAGFDYPERHADATEDGNGAYSFANGGIGGNGGRNNSGGSSYWAGGGAGWLTNGTGGAQGTDYVYTGSYAQGGRRPLEGGIGGVRYNDGSDEGGDGGFGGGGGGGSDNMGTGGGGGYSGGGGQNGDGFPSMRSGGGGGSYNSGTDQLNEAGVNDGNGYVTITLLCDLMALEPVETELCDGEEIVLDASSVSGEPIIWDMGVTDGESFAPPVGVTTYTATTDDPDDCPYSVEITVNALPEVTATADVTEICFGETITVTGGGADSYSWDPADIEDGVAYTPSETGEFTYTVTGTDATTTCTNEASIDVVINDLPEVEAIASSEELCDGDELTLTGSGAVDYSWDMGAEDGVAFTPEIGTTTYTVVGTDDNGCEKEATVEVVVHELPEVTATADQDEVCFGAQVTLTGDGADTYVWDPADVTDGEPYTTTMAGINTFTVTGTDVNGCENTATVDVTVLDEIVVTYTTTDEIMGGDGAVDIDVSGGTPAYTFDWDNDGTGDFDDTEDLTDLVGGTYTVIVMDENECTTTVEIDVNSQLGIGANGMTQVSVYPNPTNGQVTITGQGEFTYVLRSVNGAILMQNTIADSEQLDLDKFANGVYFITINWNNETKTVKLVKQ